MAQSKLTRHKTLPRTALDEIALRTQLRSSLARPWRRRKYAIAALQIIDHLLAERQPGSLKMSIRYDPEYNPPAYGEFLIVCMMQRFLARTGRMSSLIIPQEAEGHGLWGTMNPDNRKSLLQDFLKLGSSICPDGSDVTYEEVGVETHNQIDSFSALQIPLYQLAPTILTMLFRKLQDQEPSGLLLDSVQGHNELEKKTPQQPYITWNVRVGSWDPVRDISEKRIVRDFLELREIFPEHRIMILSNSAGASAVLRTLRSSGRLGPTDLGRVLAQPEPGYRAAAHFLLRSSGHFQRRGGGIAMVAIFGRIPYVIVGDHRSNFLTETGTRLVPWATTGQTYVVSRGCRADYRDYSTDLLAI